MFIKTISELFQKKKIPFAIVGGYAVAIHGVARGTFDLDIITEISKENFMRIEEALAEIGLKSIIPVSAGKLYDNLDTYINEKNLVAWNFINPAKGRDSLDILITEDIQNYAVINAETSFGFLPVLDIDSIIQLKQKSSRPQDLEDIKALREIQGGS